MLCDSKKKIHRINVNLHLAKTNIKKKIAHRLEKSTTVSKKKLIVSRQPIFINLNNLIP